MAKRIYFKDLVIWEDADYVLINKPPFISTLEDRNDPYNILEMARDTIPEAQVGHRLDKETSGILAIAKNPEAYRHLSIQFENREVRKEYHAVSDGIHDFRDLAAGERILKLSNGTVRIDRKGKEAETIFNTLHAYRRHTFIRCEPITGRMHQIRIHLAHRKASISGDPLYGGKPFYLSDIKHNYSLGKWQEEQPLIKRLALHAFSLSFKGMNGSIVEARAEYPKDFRVMLLQLDKNM